MALCWNSCRGIGRKCAFYKGFAGSVPHQVVSSPVVKTVGKAVLWPYYTRVASAHTASGAMSISPGHESVPCDASTFSKNARSRNGS